MGERKHLRVRYLFRGRLHEAIVDDVTALAAPLRGMSGRGQARVMLDSFTDSKVHCLAPKPINCDL